MAAASNLMPISSAAFAASVLGLMSDFNTAPNWVATSAVLPVTPVQVAKIAINSSMVIPNCAALPATLGNASESCSKDVTPFLAVNCILS